MAHKTLVRFGRSRACAFCTLETVTHPGRSTAPTGWPLHHPAQQLDQAAESLQKSLALDEGIDHKEGAGTAYFLLGGIRQNRGEVDEAERMYQRSLGLLQAVGAAAQVKEVQKTLATLPKRRNTLAYTLSMLTAIPPDLVLAGVGWILGPLLAYL